MVRLWREDVEPYLTAGIGLVPLAPLTDVSAESLAEVVRRMGERINGEPRGQAAKLWTAAYLLMGLRYTDELTSQLLAGVQTMRESTTYQKILREGWEEGRDEGREEGRILEARRWLLQLGTIRFGVPDGATVAALEAIQDVDRLESLGGRLMVSDLRSWHDLLAGI